MFLTLNCNRTAYSRLCSFNSGHDLPHRHHPCRLDPDAYNMSESSPKRSVSPSPSAPLTKAATTRTSSRVSYVDGTPSARSPTPPVAESEAKPARRLAEDWSFVSVAASDDGFQKDEGRMCQLVDDMNAATANQRPISEAIPRLSYKLREGCH